MISAKKIHYPGRLITFEGNEGVGKSTNAQFIANQIRQLGKEVLLTREPGGEIRAEQIRQLLLTPAETTWTADAELLLIFAARAQHLQRVILPALQQGILVVCERFTDATYAYQGGGRGIANARIKVLEDFVQQGLQPDLTFWLQLPQHLSRQRVQQRQQLQDVFEQQNDEFFAAVERGYQQRFAANPKRLIKIDASLALNHVQTQLQASLLIFIKQWFADDNY